MSTPAIPYTVLSVVVLSLFCSSAGAGSLDHGRALEGLSRVKAVFDVNQGDPGILELRLSLIDESAKALAASGRTMDFVLVFRGRATRYITVGDRYVKPEEQAVKQEIGQWIASFKAAGFTIEQCLIAARGQKIDPGDFLPQVQVVPNGYLSLIGYQNQGYGLVPME